jgi:ribonucleoside-diphosphate reductase beta chain
MGDIEGLTAQEVKNYIRFIGDRRLQQLSLEPIYGIDKNPLPWMDQMLNGAEHTNFFENRSTEYSKASTQGSWEDVFTQDVFAGNYGKKPEGNGQIAA